MVQLIGFPRPSSNWDAVQPGEVVVLYRSDAPDVALAVDVSGRGAADAVVTLSRNDGGEGAIFRLLGTGEVSALFGRPDGELIVRPPSRGGWPAQVPVLVQRSASGRPDQIVVHPEEGPCIRFATATGLLMLFTLAGGQRADALSSCMAFDAWELVFRWPDGSEGLISRADG